jgi:hypothetical protein
MNRSLRDANLTVSKALPAANANNASDSIDLGATSPGVTVESVDLVIEVPATPSLVDTKSHTLKVQDSADNASFADVAEIATVTRTGAGGAGAAATTRRVKLPPSVRRYVRLYQAVEASGGDNTAVSAKMSLNF